MLKWASTTSGLKGLFNSSKSRLSDVITDLEMGIFYAVSVAACNQKGCGREHGAKPVKTMQAPTVPQNVKAENFNATTVHILFGPPHSEGGDAVKSFVVFFDNRSMVVNASQVSFQDLKAPEPSPWSGCPLCQDRFKFPSALHDCCCSAEDCEKASHAILLRTLAHEHAILV